MCRPSASMCTVQCNFMRGQKYSANSFLLKEESCLMVDCSNSKNRVAVRPAVNQPSSNIYIGSKPFLKQIKDMCGKYILHQQKSIQKSPPVHPHSFLLQSFFFARFPASKLVMASHGRLRRLSTFRKIYSNFIFSNLNVASQPFRLKFAWPSPPCPFPRCCGPAIHIPSHL